MKRKQKIAFIALTSTSFTMILSYSLLAFFKFYFQLQHKNQILTQQCQSSPAHYYLIQRFDMTEWITLAIAAVAMILQLIAFIMVCICSKNKSKISTQNPYSQNEEAEMTNDQLKKREMGVYENEKETTLSQTSIFKNKATNRILGINFHIIIIFALFIGIGVNIGHMVKGSISLEKLSDCTANLGQQIRMIFQNYIILSALIGYSFISVMFRIIILLIDKFSKNQSYLVGIGDGRVCQQIAIQTSQNTLSLSTKVKREEAACKENQRQPCSKIEERFHMPKLKLGKYYENVQKR